MPGIRKPHSDRARRSSQRNFIRYASFGPTWLTPGEVTPRYNTRRPVIFGKVVELNPADVQARSNLARALALSGNVKEAAIHLQRVLELEPDNGTAHAYLGAALLAQDKLDMAIRHLRRAVKLKPNFLPAHQYLVTALKKAGQLEAANQQLEYIHRLQSQRAPEK